MNQIPFGVVGVGHLGAHHARLAAQIPSLKLLGVFDQDPQRCREIAAECACQACPSLDHLLQQVQAVSIVVPTEQHFTVAEQALQQGCHLFVEKPITSSTEQARALVQHSQAQGIVLQVGHIERFNPAFLALQDYQLAPMFIEAHRLSQFNPRGTDVSVVLDLMIHDIDIVLSLIPFPVQAIHACGVGVVSGSEDIANARLEFAHGAVANLTASRISAKDMRKMRMFQKSAYLSMDFLHHKTEILHLQDAALADNLASTCIGHIGTGPKAQSVLLHTPEKATVNALHLELESFAQAILGDSPPPVTGMQGLRALEVAETIMAQMAAQPVPRA